MKPKTPTFIAIASFLTLFILSLTIPFFMISSSTTPSQIDTPQTVPSIPVPAFNALASTDPDAPELLEDNSYQFETFPSNYTNYYYETYNMSASSYHLVWLHTLDYVHDDFDLYLYSDPDYSNKLGDSLGVGAMDWVVYNPSISNKTYVRVITFWGNGSARIEAETAQEIAVGGSYTPSLDDEEMSELAQCDLETTQKYRITLTPDPTADWKFYVFRVAENNCTKEDLHTRDSGGVGEQEQIVFTPSANGTYALVMIRASGTGNAKIQVDPIPLLLDDVGHFRTFNTEDWLYCFETYYAGVSDYHLVWTALTGSVNDLDLYLMSDASYTYSQGSSLAGGAVEWLVTRLSTYKNLHPAVWTDDLGGPTGSAFIECESGNDIIVDGAGHTASLSSGDCGTIAETDLYMTYTYDVGLRVPAGCNFDLYVFRTGTDNTTQLDYHNSSSAVLGQDERICFTPDTDASYALVAIRRSGSGEAYISVSTVPTLIDDGEQLRTFYIEDWLYYFETYSATSDDYHLVWTALQGSVNDLDLYLMTDNTYAVQLGSSLAGGAVEWIAIRPSSTGLLYPAVWTDDLGGPTGSTYIECESAYDITADGAGYAASLSSSDCGAIAEAYLSTTNIYDVGLQVPDGCDFDLYVFRTTAGFTTQWDYHNSSSAVLGRDERITFTPDQNATYALVAIRRSGTGQAIILVSIVSTLSDDVGRFRTFYTEDWLYPFETYSAGTDDYHLIWTALTGSVNDLDLYLMTDDTYAVQLGSSLSGGAVEWIVIRPSSTGLLYPAVWTDDLGGASGSTFIECESGHDIVVDGAGLAASLSSGDCGTIAETPLYTTNTYDVSLTVPASCNFDLYVFRTTAGFTTKWDYHNSSSGILGQDERICFTPDTNASYALVAIRRSGSGVANITVRTVPILSDDGEQLRTFYSEDWLYYFQTYSATSDDYHLIWTALQGSVNDLDLYLMTDDTYAVQLGSSLAGGAVEWIVTRPSSTGLLYPAVWTDDLGGPTGSIYIECESAHDITVDGAAHAASLNSGDYGAIAETPLYSTNTYDVKLTVPAGCNFDLYVFRTTAGFTTQWDYHNSSSAVLGRDEQITFTPDMDDSYALVAIRRSGTGEATITVSIHAEGGGIPGFEMSYILLGMCLVLNTAVIASKRRKILNI
jgi:hypothetical protein